MEICHIHFSNFPYQTTPIPYEITRNLMNFGINSHVIALSFNHNEKLDEVIEGIQVTRVPIVNSQRNFFTLDHFSKAVKNVLVRKNFDLIHVYAFRGSSYLKLRNRGRSNKWIYHLITGNVSGGFKSTLINRITKFDSLFFPTKIVNTINVGRWVLGSDSYFEIPPGVDTNRFLPGINQKLRRSLDISEEDIVAVYSGSLSHLRKLEVLVKGFSLAYEKCNKLRLIIFGPGDFSSIDNLSTQLNLKDRVTNLGKIPYSRVQDYISIADIGLAYVPITPEYNPQPALKTLEMLSAGKPVVATATEGNAYFIDDGHNGILVEDNPDNISAGIIKLIDDPLLAKKISQAARSSIYEFDWAKIIKDKLIPIYSELIG